MRIRFAPAELRAFMGNLLIMSNAKNTPNLNIILIGEGEALGNISTNAADNTIDFGKVKVTKKDTFKLIINNKTLKVLILALSILRIIQMTFQKSRKI
jgi:hypothetical protein